MSNQITEKNLLILFFIDFHIGVFSIFRLTKAKIEGEIYLKKVL